MGVISLQEWENIRVSARAHGESIKSIARRTGHSKNTVRKYLRSANAPAVATSPRTSVLAPYRNEIDELLRATPKITAARIIIVLQDRHDTHLPIGERAARKFIAAHRRKVVPQEAFVRLVYQPGSQMQIDFKEIFLELKGQRVKHYLFSARLSYSGAFFGKVYRSEDGAALLDGILSACVSFDGAASECVFDNAKTAVTKVLRGRKRQVTESYANLVGALGMQMRFAAPAKGNQKGGVEGVHGYIEDNFFRPLRSGNDMSALNDQLRLFCSGHATSGSERFLEERKKLHQLPEHLPSPARIYPACINKFAEVTFATNRYSVPSRYAHREGEVHVYPDRVEVAVDRVIVARHARCFERRAAILEPLHFLELLSEKHRAVECAEVFSQETFPKELKELLTTYLHDDHDHAGRNFMRVMALRQYHTMERLVTAVALARERGTADGAAIELILQQEFDAPTRAKPHVLCDTPQPFPKITVDLSAYATVHIGGMLQ